MMAESEASVSHPAAGSCRGAATTLRIPHPRPSASTSPPESGSRPGSDRVTPFEAGRSVKSKSRASSPPGAGGGRLHRQLGLPIGVAAVEVAPCRARDHSRAGRQDPPLEMEQREILVLASAALVPSRRARSLLRPATIHLSARPTHAEDRGLRTSNPGVQGIPTRSDHVQPCHATPGAEAIRNRRRSRWRDAQSDRDDEVDEVAGATPVRAPALFYGSLYRLSNGWGTRKEDPMEGYVASRGNTSPTLRLPV